MNCKIYYAAMPFVIAGDMVTSRDLARILSRLDKIGVRSQAGRVARLDLGGFGGAAIPRSHWPDVEAIQQQIHQRWHPEVGDCRQELVFIGIGLDEIELYDSLEACLLTDEEMAAGPAGWTALPDPFPPWRRTVEDYLQLLVSNESD